mmetsp:Transcript_83829/g.241012  ORF Transcript_83829/g.241012 Transcript_83829/m.241012 type:complete len:243 (-) Transcript_83829:203-931(-)
MFSICHSLGILDSVCPHQQPKLLPRRNTGQLQLLQRSIPRKNPKDLASVLASRQVLDVRLGPRNMPILAIMLLKSRCRHGKSHHLLELHGLWRERGIPPPTRSLSTSVCKVPELAKLHAEDQDIEPYQTLLVGELVQDRERHLLRPALCYKITWTSAFGQRLLAALSTSAFDDLRHGIKATPCEDSNHASVSARSSGFRAGPLQCSEVPGVDANNDVVLKWLELPFPQRSQCRSVGQKVRQP